MEGRIGPTATAVVTVDDLARELKRWMRRRDNRRIKVATVAKRLGISQSTLYAYLAGTTLPPTEVLDDLLQLLEVPSADQRRLATARDSLHRQRRRGVPPPAQSTPPDPAFPVPRELPLDPSGFIGRGTEVESLDRALTTAAQGSSPVTLSLLSGIAGVGKTALAIRWAHRVADQFPDGCLYVDLLGYSASEPRRPADALAGFLRALDVPDAEIPEDTDERARRFRSRVAGRRLLLVLDNAGDADQVRPLLPGDVTCFVVATSRAELPGLQVRPGAHQIPLEPLGTEAGVELLQAQLPGDAPAPVARELAERCGGLPLTLRIVAAQASARPGQPLRDLASDLGGGRGLDRFDIGEETVQSVFSWSVRRLEPDAARAFGLLGATPLQDFDVDAAGALLGSDPAATRRHLDALARAQLLQARRGCRFGMHDLLREYADERADNLPERDAALVRLVDHYVTRTTHAMAVLHAREPSRAGTTHTDSLEFAGAAEADAWLDDEWMNLMALVSFTAEREWPVLTCALGEAIRPHLDQGGHFTDAVAMLGLAVRATRLTGGRTEEAACLRELGVACMRLGRLEESMSHGTRAAEIYREVGDRNGEAGMLNNLGNLFERLGRYEEAREHYLRALPIAVETGHLKGEATLLTNIGYVDAQLGDHDRARELLHRGLDLFKQVGDLGGTARTLGNLGDLDRRCGHHRAAFTHLRRGLDRAREIGATGIETEILNALGETHLESGSWDRARSGFETALSTARDLGDRYEEARSLEGIGRALAPEGRRDEAVATWRDALEIYRRLGLPEADRVAGLIADPATWVAGLEFA